MTKMSSGKGGCHDDSRRGGMEKRGEWENDLEPGER